MRSLTFIQQCFHNYYAEDFSLDSNIRMIKEREFGFVSFQGWMQRHKSFQDKEELLSFLMSSVPRDGYISSARYEDPEADMDKKGWLGADLIFDIDADHILTSCNKIHDEWACGQCGFAGKGTIPEKCPVCNGEKFNTNIWPCEVCLNSAKAETVKVLDMLTCDFGFCENDLHVFFSGHRGYHIHVESAAVETLDTVARKEIVDYVSGIGLNLSVSDIEHMFRSSIKTGQSFQKCGWGKRLLSGMKALISDASEQDLARIGVDRREARSVLRNRDSTLFRDSETKGIREISGVGPATWTKIAKQGVRAQAAEVDTVVTTDIHRLIRLTETLHGKTGFRKVEVAGTSIDSFDPFTSAVAFIGGSATVLVYDSPKFRLGNETFGPYRNQKVELPTAAAVLLVCKNRGEVIDSNV